MLAEVVARDREEVANKRWREGERLSDWLRLVPLTMLLEDDHTVLGLNRLYLPEFQGLSECYYLVPSVQLEAKAWRSVSSRDERDRPRDPVNSRVCFEQLTVWNFIARLSSFGHSAGQRPLRRQGISRFQVVAESLCYSSTKSQVLQAKKSHLLRRYKRLVNSGVLPADKPCWFINASCFDKFKEFLELHRRADRYLKWL